MPKGRLICETCRKQLTDVMDPFCMKCGKQLCDEQREYCYDCRRKQFSYDRGFAVFVYEERLQNAIADFKFRNRKEYGRFFAAEMSRYYQKYLQALRIEALVPVPIHKSKKAYRGYNQSEVLCDELSKLAGIPVNKELMIRTKKTIPQKILSAAERLKNLSDAIQPVKKHRASEDDIPERVLLVDDIYTTGSTAEACSRVLKGIGVKEVYLLNIGIGLEE